MRNRILREIDARRKDLDALERTLSILDGTETIHGIKAGNDQDDKGVQQRNIGATVLGMIREILTDGPLSIGEIHKRMGELGNAMALQTLRAKIYSAAKAGKLEKIKPGVFAIKK